MSQPLLNDLNGDAALLTSRRKSGPQVVGRMLAGAIPIEDVAIMGIRSRCQLIPMRKSFPQLREIRAQHGRDGNLLVHDTFLVLLLSILSNDKLTVDPNGRHLARPYARIEADNKHELVSRPLDRSQEGPLLVFAQRDTVLALALDALQSRHRILADEFAVHGIFEHLPQETVALLRASEMARLGHVKREVHAVCGRDRAQRPVAEVGNDMLSESS